MNGKEQRRAMILTAAVEGRLTAGEAADLMSLSGRQERRLRHVFRRDGPAALVHGNRGRKPVHTLDLGLRKRVATLAEGEYSGCNDQHLTELLAEREGITLSRSSVRRIRRAAGLPSPQRRRAPRHRSRRERMPQAGMLLQVDGSRHQWLGPDGPWLTLVGAIDDATGDVPYAVFREQEDAQGYLLLLREVVRKRGVPLALYSDRHGIFVRNGKEPWTLSEELAGRREPTQVARALEELGVNLILARSPQAKGRVERLWRTLQDRLYQELRLDGVTTLEQANAALPALLARHNARFRQSPAEAGSTYRRLPAGKRPADVFCFRYWRTVSKDNVVSLENRLIPIPPGPGRRSYARCRVEVREHLDGSATVHYQGARIARQRPRPGDLRTKRRGKPGEKPAPPPLLSTPKPARTTARKPPANHPWRRSPVTPPTPAQRTFSQNS
jgi:transposase